MVPARAMKAFATHIAVTQREGARLALAATARSEEARVIREQKARAGIVPTLTRVVDGRRGAAYDQVRDNGVIILQWRYLREIVTVAMARLKARSPERSGDYKRGLMLFVGNAQATISAAGIPEGATNMTIVATMPYSRRLEVGKDAKGGPFVVQVPQHIVQETAMLLARDYRGVARIKFTYEDVQGPGGRAARPSTGSRRKDRRRDVSLRYPAISIVDIR